MKELSASARDHFRQLDLRLAATVPLKTPDEAFAEARKIVDNKVEGPRR